MDEKLRLAALWAPLVQALFTAVVALCAGYWTWATHHEDQLRTAQERDRQIRNTQNTAISLMSRQLGLMEAQCDQAPLRDLGDKPTLTLRQEQCYDAYIGARSLVFLSQLQIVRRSDVKAEDWSEAWRALSESLRDAGVSTYFRAAVSDRWQTIVSLSEQ